MGQIITNEKALELLTAAANAVTEEMEEKYLRPTPQPDLYFAAMDGATMALSALRIAVIALAEIKLSTEPKTDA